MSATGASADLAAAICEVGSHWGFGGACATPGESIPLEGLLNALQAGYRVLTESSELVPRTRAALLRALAVLEDEIDALGHGVDGSAYDLAHGQRRTAPPRSPERCRAWTCPERASAGSPFCTSHRDE